MLLRQLVHVLDDCQLLGGSLDVEICQITDHSAQVLPQSMFICVVGYRTDGHRFIREAITSGAVCIVAEIESKEWLSVMEPETDRLHEITFILVNDSRKALACLAAAFYGNPSESLSIIGVTGTKGKTTTACMIHRMLEHAGVKAGLIGTLGASYGEIHEELEMTTPKALTLHRLLSQMKALGCTHVVMEVSSQALMCGRVYGLRFDVGIFTNLYPDHIGPGEHSSIDEYAHWKSTLFQMVKVAVLNMGADRWTQMRDACIGKWLGYRLVEDEVAIESSKPNRCPIYRRTPDLIGVTERNGKVKLRGVINGELIIDLPGSYNRENALAALLTVFALGFTDIDLQSLSDLQIPGRTEVLHGDSYQVVIDYAHNESGMINVLTALRMMEHRRLICVYGSGGNRSPLRRVGMGRAAGKQADLSILTEDNSRHEKLSDILDGLIEGVTSVDGKYIVIKDRREAIHTAIMNAQEGDLIAILGKGHEEYQEIGVSRIPFSDREEARLAIQKRNAECN